jgi:hypothetical protein
VILQEVLADDKELVTPALVVVVGEVEDDVHEIADVLDTGSMMMKVDDGSCLMLQHRQVEVVVRDRLV